MSLCGEQVSINAVAYVTSEHQCKSLCGKQATIKVQSFSVLLVKLEGTVLMDTLLGTIVMVLVALTKIWYKPGSPSFGTKSVGTIKAILAKERRKKQRFVRIHPE